MALHLELVNRRREVLADHELLGRVPDAHGELALAPEAPDGEGELDAHVQNALIDLFRLKLFNYDSNLYKIVLLIYYIILYNFIYIIKYFIF